MTTTTDRTYHEGETFFLPVTISLTGTPDDDGEVRVTTVPAPDYDIYAPASALLPSDRIYQAPEGFRIPSDHHLAHLPLHWRQDRRIFERICAHGVGHPDPDNTYRPGDDGTHGCDGCCANPDRVTGR